MVPREDQPQSAHAAVVGGNRAIYVETADDFFWAVGCKHRSTVTPPFTFRFSGGIGRAVFGLAEDYTDARWYAISWAWYIHREPEPILIDGMPVYAFKGRVFDHYLDTRIVSAEYDWEPTDVLQIAMSDAGTVRYQYQKVGGKVTTVFESRYPIRRSVDLCGILGNEAFIFDAEIDT